MSERDDNPAPSGADETLPRELWREAYEAQRALHKAQRDQQRALLEARLDALRLEQVELDAELGALTGRGDWKRRFKPALEHGFLHVEPPPRQSLLNLEGVSVLPRGKVGLFVGEGGVGKSWALTQLAISVATGKLWLDTFEVQPEAIGAVALVLAEEDEAEFHRRVGATVKGMKLGQRAHDLLDANLWAWPLDGELVEFLREGQPSPAHTSFVELLKERAPQGGWRLIVLDPASRFMGADAETDNAQATRFVQLLEQLTKLPGQPTVICAHHTNKGSRTGQLSAKNAGAARGASGLTDGARWVGNLFAATQPDGEPIDDVAIFAISKSNYGPRPEPIYLQRERSSGVLLRSAAPSASPEPPFEPRPMNGARPKNGGFSSYDK